MKRFNFIKIMPMAIIGLLLAPKIKAKEEQYRKVQYYDNGWKDIEFEDMKDGMRIRMFEPTGEPVDLGSQSIIVGNAFQNEQGMWAVSIKSFNRRAK